MSGTHYRTCHLCEANCGLVIEIDDGKVLSIKGDPQNALSRGHICPKATAIADIQNDPDRLRRPLKRTGDRWEEVSWASALEEIGERFRTLGPEPGRSAALYFGNPTAHNYGIVTQMHLLKKAARTRNVFSAATTDQMPQNVAAMWVYGHMALVPMPDIDRTRTLVVLGGNPKVSNGSGWTVPDFTKRLKDLQVRGGKLIVIDPRHTETAALADRHLFIRPGGDVFFLIALLLALDEGGLVNPGRLAEMVTGWDRVWAAIREFDLDRCARAAGMDPDAVRGIAKELAAGPAALYGRMGTTAQMFGTTVHWLIHLVNIAAGNLDREGGMMFGTPAADLVTGSNGGSYDRYRSRVSGHPETMGEFPAVALPEEIETPGEGQVCALITVAGNPVLSNPNGPRLARALGNLDLMVSVDIYLNETTRHAHFILPPCGPLENDHYGLLLLPFAVRSFTKYSLPMFDKGQDEKADWEILRALAGTLDPGLKDAAPLPRDILDMLLQNGPYGLTLSEVENAPHGLDLGPLKPRLPERLQTEDNKIHLAPDILIVDLERVRAQLGSAGENGLLLIGRRHIRSNNSWLHNSRRLVKGKNRCTLMMNPEDARARNLGDGSMAEVSSRTGRVRVPVEITQDMMPGVVSLPHGWGHDLPGVSLSVAKDHAGVSVNDVTDETLFDPLSGNAAFNGVPVEVSSV